MNVFGHEIIIIVFDNKKIYNYTTSLVARIYFSETYLPSKGIKSLNLAQT